MKDDSGQGGQRKRSRLSEAITPLKPSQLTALPKGKYMEKEQECVVWDEYTAATKSMRKCRRWKCTDSVHDQGFPSYCTGSLSCSFYFILPSYSMNLIGRHGDAVEELCGSRTAGHVGEAAGEGKGREGGSGERGSCGKISVVVVVVKPLTARVVLSGSCLQNHCG